MPDAQPVESAIKAAVAGGSLLLRHYYDRLSVSRKESLRDIVTEVDKIAENRIVDILRAADGSTPILAEESEASAGALGDQYWVVDSLDGTVNYVNGVPLFAVSIALFRATEPVVAAVYCPMAGDLYYGAEGVGAFKNRSLLRVKDKPAQECLFAVAFSGKNYDPMNRGREFLLMGEVNDSSRGCLRTGSASMNLAYLAEGRFGGCWGKANKFWDIGAGLLLARLAGATVVSKQLGAESHLASYAAAVPSAWQFLREKVKDVLGFEDA